MLKEDSDFTVRGEKYAKPHQTFTRLWEGSYTLYMYILDPEEQDLFNHTGISELPGASTERYFHTITHHSRDCKVHMVRTIQIQQTNTHDPAGGECPHLCVPPLPSVPYCHLSKTPHA